MAIRIHEAQSIADDALPVEQLAAQMRLADQYDTVPGQLERLRLRLRSAIGAIERRLGQALLVREFKLMGLSNGGRDVPLPVSPVDAVLGGETVRFGTPVPFEQVTVDQSGLRPVAQLPISLLAGEQVTLTVRAGYGGWDMMPDDLQQAVLLLAESFDQGGGVIPPEVEALLAPHRTLRIGGGF